MSHKTDPVPACDAVIEDLHERLDEAADPAVRAWLENYLKNVIAYRGVKMPQVVRIVATWSTAHGLRQWPQDDQLRVAVSLIEGARAEDKFAGILVIQKHLTRRMPAARLVTVAEDLLARGAFSDWATSDSFSMRVLAPLIRVGGHGVAERIAGWVTAPNLWQRRAAIVPLRAVVHDPSFHPLIERTIAALAGDEERFVQTGIGWVVSDMAKVHTDLAAALVERHFDDLSSEVIRRHTRYLPAHRSYRERKRKMPR